MENKELNLKAPMTADKKQRTCVVLNTILFSEILCWKASESLLQIKTPGEAFASQQTNFPPAELAEFLQWVVEKLQHRLKREQKTDRQLRRTVVYLLTTGTIAALTDARFS